MNADLMTRLKAANPVPEIAPLDAAGERLLARIFATPEASALPAGHARAHRLRVAAIAAAALLGVAGPAAGVASHYGLFDLSNRGQPIDETQLDLDEASALAQSGFGGDVRRLGERAGIAFYVAKGARGGLCFATGSAAGATPRLNHFMGCQRPGPEAFPSTQQPIVDLSPLKSFDPRKAVYVQRLAGFAADGVARVGFVDTSGVIHSTPVVNNVYATDWLDAPIAATAIVALDEQGQTLYTKELLLSPRATKRK
jgi:hypothetical protein